MIKQVCNMCGNEFSQWDKQENFGMNYHVGYGSLFDGDDINLDLCCECFDNMMKDYILPKCKINPVKSFYDEYAKNIEETEGSEVLQADSNKIESLKKESKFYARMKNSKLCSPEKIEKIMNNVIDKDEDLRNRKN